MFDSIFNLLFVLIPVAIIIGRTVTRARNRRAPPPPQPRIPIHFEDDEEDDIPQSISKMHPASLPVVQQHSASHPAGHSGLDTPRHYIIPPESPSPIEQARAAKANDQSGKVFSLNIAHLSPLKQAVVMAEVLGPPKGVL